MHILDTTISKEDFNNYLASHANKEIKDFVKRCDDEDYLECKRVGFEGREKWLFDELWLIDIGDKNGGYTPLIIQNINTSSPYAMWTSCLFNREDDEEEEEEEDENKTSEKVNFDIILDLVTKGYKRSLENLLNKNYSKLLN